MINKNYYNKNNKENLDKEDIKKLFRIYKEKREKEVRDILIEEHLYIAEILSKSMLIEVLIMMIFIKLLVLA